MLRFKFNPAQFNRILFSSDFHLGHRKEFVFEARGFRSVEEHAVFIEHALQSLDPSDLLVFCGDFSLNSTVEDVRKWISMIPCKTLMVWGNHNSGIRQIYQDALVENGFAKGLEVYPLNLNENVVMCGDQIQLDIGKNKFHVQHMAPRIWDEVNRGRKCICGHSHGSLIGANPHENSIGQILDVGVDNALKENGTPFFSLDEVVKFLNSKTVLIEDHHA